MIMTFNEFKKLARKGNVIPLFKEMIIDMDTPVSLFRKLAESREYSYLLESLEGGEHWGRYSFLSYDPEKVFRVEKGRVKITEGRKTIRESRTTDPLRSLQEFIKEYKPVHLNGLPRFWGGVVGYISYDCVRYYEKIGSTLKSDLELPESVFVLSGKVLIFDHLKHKLIIVSVVNTSKPSSLKKLYDRSVNEILSIEKSIRSELKTLKAPGFAKKSAQKGFQSNIPKQDFIGAVKKAKEYIYAGDCIQVVLSQRFSKKTNAKDFDIYRALRIVNPSPYLYYFKAGNFSLVGSSPEILVRKEGDNIETRPIAGTRRRGYTLEEDLKLERELLNDKKELAEHLMLVDLGRNDLGRIAKTGSVNVTEYKTVERYSHVMHIVSQVKAKLAGQYGAKDVFRAAFPAGTVSGAPKVRAMQIIEELEVTRRGPYAGALGYFSFEGNMDMAITIRTIIVKGGTAYVQAGAGIVADSQPELEYKETQNKARALFKAVELAEAGI